MCLPTLLYAVQRFAVAGIGAPVALAVLVAAAGGLPGLALGDGGTDASVAATDSASATMAQERVPPADELVSVGNATSEHWLYTSRTRSPQGRVLALNVVVTGSADRVREALTERTDANWTPVEGHQAIRLNASPAVEADPKRSTASADEPAAPNDPNDSDSLLWRDARGGARYTYVVTGNESTGDGTAGESTDDGTASESTAAADGEWVDASYQLGDGTYLGKRIHLRAYASPNGEWTAIQAHSEYWDWYRLGHTVTGATAAAEYVRTDLADEPFVASVRTHNHGLEGGGSPGWLVVVELATIAIVGSVARTRSIAVDRDALALPIAIAGVVVGVRLLGIASDVILPSISQKPFVAILYPVLVLGPPLAVYAFARDDPPLQTAAISGGALAVGIVLDAVVVGITRIPWALVQHRLVLVGAFAILAAGIAARDRRWTWIGALAWLAVIAAPLLGVL
jgi:hypothetical protein